MASKTELRTSLEIAQRKIKTLEYERRRYQAFIDEKDRKIKCLEKTIADIVQAPKVIKKKWYNLWR